MASGARRDRPEAKDPREKAGLIRGVPKTNLRKVLKAQGTSQSEFEHMMGVGGKSVSRWMSGTRHMSNNEVAHASWLLEVNPLYLLDMTDDPQVSESPESPRTDAYLAQARRSMAEAVATLDDPMQLIGPAITRTGDLLVIYYLNGFEQQDRLVVPGERTYTERELRPWEAEEAWAEDNAKAEVLASIRDDLVSQAKSSLAVMPGDYRDIGALARALLDYALEKTSDGQTGRIFKALTEACIGHRTEQSETGPARTMAPLIDLSESEPDFGPPWLQHQ